MKRSGTVKIALVAGLAMAGCGRRQYDPCTPQTFNQEACQDAVSHNGYYYHGSWIPHSYYGGYTHYYNDYYGYVRSGGNVRTISPSEWTRPAGAVGATTGTSGTGSTTTGTTTRGVFGSSAHGSGGGE